MTHVLDWIESDDYMRELLAAMSDTELEERKQRAAQTYAHLYQERNWRDGAIAEQLHDTAVWEQDRRRALAIKEAHS